MSLDSLYQETILDHYSNPRNYGTLGDAQAKVHQENPSCGDQIDLQLLADKQGRIQAIKFSGDGCAISQASASMMTSAVEGKTLDEARTLLENFRGMLIDDSAPAIDLGDLEALKGVRKFPVRVRCAMLPWTALEKLLNASREAENSGKIDRTPHPPLR